MVVEILSFKGHLKFSNIETCAKATYICILHNIEIEREIDIEILEFFMIKIPAKSLLVFMELWISYLDWDF